MAADDAPKIDLKVNADDAANYWLSEGHTPGGVMRQVDYAKASQGLHPSLKGIKIVDCDTHFTEPPDLFSARAPAKYQDRLPQLKRVNGVDQWMLGDRSFGTMGGNVIAADNNKLLGRLAFQTREEGHPGSFLVKPRLQAMDEMGVHAQICFQNSGLTQAGTLMSMGDPEIGVVMLKIYNEAAAERQVESGQRLFTLGHLPIWNHAEMMAEAQRCLDMDLKGFVLPDKPERLGLPSYTNAYFAPLFELCESTGTPINYHLNAAINPSAMTWEELGFEQRLAVASMMFSVGNAATLGNFMVSGLFDTYPNLKVGLIESGLGWVPFVVEMMEHQFDEMMPNFSKKLQKRPWEYFRQNFWVTYWYEKIGPKQLLETVGVDRVLFETDYPHPTSLYPNVQEHIVDTLGGYDYEVRKKVLQTNATGLYNLPF